MQGYRTIIALWVSAVVSPWLVTRTGLPLTPEMEAQLVAAVIAAIGTGMRLITKTPFGRKPLIAFDQLDPKTVERITAEVIADLKARANRSKS